jgi:tape measure domain-containing protein
MADRLEIQIDGNASGLTKALKDVQAKLGAFNTSLNNSNKTLTAFTKGLTTSGAALSRLTTNLNALGRAAAGLSRQLTGLGSSIDRLGKQARQSSTDLRAFSSALTASGTRLNSLGVSARGAGTSLTSLNRRAAALGATITALNGQLRGLVRSAGAASGAMGSAAGAAGKTAGAVTAAGSAATGAAVGFNRLHRASAGWREDFRRGVAQLTAFRTLTYQGLFWFAPLIYSIVKVNKEYETQMVLLRNVARATEESAKRQEAAQTRTWLLNKAQTNPFSLEQITDSFVKMRVGGVEPMNGSLQVLMDTIASFGGNNSSLQRASVAIQQMGGKGVISMEELRQQLGEHVPDAARAMAAGMGLSMGELYKTIESGTVESSMALNKMFAVLRNEHYGAAKEMMNTWTGLIARLGTAWQQFVVKLTTSTNGANGFIETLKTHIQELIFWLNTPAGVNFGVQVQEVFAKIINVFVNAIKLLYEWREQIVAVAKLVLLFWGGRFVVGTIIAVIRSLTILNLVGKGTVQLFRVMTGATSAASAAAAIFGSNVRKSGTALGIFNAAGRLSISVLATMAVRFLATAGVVGLLTMAVWGLVSALNAQSNAQARLNNLKHQARTGGTYATQGEYDKDAAKWRRDDSAIRGAKKTNGGILLGNGQLVTQAQFDSFKKRHEEERVAINTVATNTRNANNDAAYFAHSQKLESGSATNPVEAMYAERKKSIVENKTMSDSEKGKALNKLNIERSKAMAGALGNEVISLEGQLARTTDTAKKKAIQDRINKINSDRAEFLQGADYLGADNAFTSKDDKDKKKKGGGKTKVDPAERYRNQFENEFVQTQELMNEYTNLRDGIDTPFDSEAAQQQASKIAQNIKEIETLEQMKRAEQDKQRELKKSIEVEKAIIQLKDETLNKNAETLAGFDALDRGYESILQNSENYRDSLEREYRSELAIIEARVRAGNATKDQIRQYRELKAAIDDAVRAKEAEMLLQLSEEAQGLNEEYMLSFLSTTQQELYNINKELKRYEDALTAAQTLRDTSQNDYAAALAEGVIKEQERAEAVASGSDKAIEKVNEEIAVIAVRNRQAEEGISIASRAIPYLEERIRILREEEAIRSRMGGAAGPLYAWAKETSKPLDSIGQTFGDVLVNNLDEFIDKLAEGKLAFKEFAKTVLKQLLLIIIRALIAKAILAALGLGGYSGPAEAPVSLGDAASYSPIGGGHGGMVAGGTPRFVRSVDSGMFAFAQRYHTGGIAGIRDNEVPIIAEKGEGIFTQEQMKALGQDKGGSNVQVNVINQTGTEAQIERRPPRFDGEKWVEDIILKKMSRPGPVRDVMQAWSKK